MAMRNFWVDAQIDGRETRSAGGPISKDGGMTVEVKQRRKGVSVKAVKVVCEADGDTLKTKVYIGDGFTGYCADPVAEFQTER